jgi:hypothetical protein
MYTLKAEPSTADVRNPELVEFDGIGPGLTQASAKARLLDGETRAVHVFDGHEPLAVIVLAEAEADCAVCRWIIRGGVGEVQWLHPKDEDGEEPCCSLECLKEMRS